DLVRLPADAGGLPHLPRQRAAHPIVMGDAGHEGRPGRPRLRGRRHGLGDDRGERGLRRRHDAPDDDRRARPPHQGAGEDPRAARHAVPRGQGLRLARPGRLVRILLDLQIGHSDCGYPRRAVLRLVVAGLAALAALGAWAAPAAAQTTQLFPGTTYESAVEFTPHGPVSVHVVLGPRPVGLYRLRPVLSDDSVVRRQTVSAMEKRLSAQATSVGVNGDYFSPSDGHPSGILLHDGILATSPNSA